MLPEAGAARVEQQELKCFLARVYLLPVESTSYYWSVGNKNNDLLISSTDISCVVNTLSYCLGLAHWGWVNVRPGPVWAGVHKIQDIDWTVQFFLLLFQKYLSLIFSRCSTVAFCTFFGKKSFQINQIQLKYTLSHKGDRSQKSFKRIR